MTSSDLLARAAVAADRNDWTTAVKVLEEAPPTNDVLDKRGWYASRAKHYKQAIADFELLRNRRPEDYRPPYMIGYQYYQQKAYREAIPYFTEALARKPDYVKCLWRLAYSLSQVGKGTSALVQASKIMRIWCALPPEQQHDERRFYAWACAMAGRHQRTKDPQGAAELFAKAVEHEPRNPYHQYQLARVLRVIGRHDEAVAAITEAGRLKPGDTHIELEHAATLAATGQADDALTSVRQVGTRCRGWVAVKAAKLAVQLKDDVLGLRLYLEATRDPAVRADAAVQQELQRLSALYPDQARPLARRHSDRESRTGSRRRSRDRSERSRAQEAGAQAAAVGTVDVINEERNFGFVVSADGTRRHFRPSSCPGLRKGDRVAFTPGTAAKGPTAVSPRRLDD